MQIRQYCRSSILLLRLTTPSSLNMVFSIQWPKRNLKALPKPHLRRILTMIPTPMTLDIRRRRRRPNPPRRNLHCMVSNGGASSSVCVALFGRITLNPNSPLVDEAHNIKNVKTKGAIACCELQARFRWCLTGTPMYDRPFLLYGPS